MLGGSSGDHSDRSAPGLAHAHNRYAKMLNALLGWGGEFGAQGGVEMVLG